MRLNFEGRGSHTAPLLRDRCWWTDVRGQNHLEEPLGKRKNKQVQKGRGGGEGFFSVEKGRLSI